jgi:peroxiredoxin Q/BCP
MATPKISITFDADLSQLKKATADAEKSVGSFENTVLDFSKKTAEFEKLDCVILGVSRDNVVSHCKFIEKYKLSISLLADETGEVCKSYDVIQEKSMFGKKYFGIDRSTFLIDKMGRVIDSWSSVKVKGHVEEVLKNLEKHIKSA